MLDSHTASWGGVYSRIGAEARRDRIYNDNNLYLNNNKAFAPLLLITWLSAAPWCVRGGALSAWFLLFRMMCVVFFARRY